MKTTLDISDNIMLRAKALARKRHRTFRSLAEQGLLSVIEQLEAEEAVSVTPVTFGGNGINAEFAGKGWSEIRDAAYEGHGA